MGEGPLAQFGLGLNWRRACVNVEQGGDDDVDDGCHHGNGHGDASVDDGSEEKSYRTSSGFLLVMSFPLRNLFASTTTFHQLPANCNNAFQKGTTRILYRVGVSDLP